MVRSNWSVDADMLRRGREAPLDIPHLAAPCRNVPVTSTLDRKMAYVVDTNIFNKLLDGLLRPEDLPADRPYVATHVQVREINNTGDKDKERRARLFMVFAEIGPKMLPTETFIWGASKWGDKLGDGVLLEKLKQELDELNGAKRSNFADALIAEVGIANGYTLLTTDRDLAEVAGNHGGEVVHYAT